MTNKIELVCPIKPTSDKVYNLAQGNTSKKTLRLPELNYGPICMKILKEFINHHKLPNDLPIPEKGLFLEESLARIFNVMLYSMGEQKREELLKDSEEYLRSL